MSADGFEAVMGGIFLTAVFALGWLWSGSVEEQRIVETCDNYGSFVYQDVRYTCEKVEELK
jgi:hypothetical protein